MCIQNDVKTRNSDLLLHYLLMDGRMKMLHAATGETLFLESFDFTGISETGTELAKIVEVCVALAKEKYNTEI